MYRKTYLTLFLFAGLSNLLIASSKADYLVNTLNSPTVSSPESPIPNGGSIAQQFTTTPTTQFTTYQFISGLDMKLYNPSSLQTGTVTFDLYSNAAGSQQKNDLPGTLIATIGSVSTSTIGTTPTTVNLTGFSLPISMSTRYWVVATLTNAGASSISYDVNNDVAAFNPGGTVFTYATGGNVWQQDPRTTTQPLNMAIFVSVPEPSTYALTALGVVALGYVGRRRRLNQQAEVTNDITLSE